MVFEQLRDMMFLWTKKFLEDQGVNIKETVLYQDNMSSMLLE